MKFTYATCIQSEKVEANTVFSNWWLCQRQDTGTKLNWR